MFFGFSDLRSWDVYHRFFVVLGLDDWKLFVRQRTSRSHSTSFLLRESLEGMFSPCGTVPCFHSQAEARQANYRVDLWIIAGLQSLQSTVHNYSGLTGEYNLCPDLKLLAQQGGSTQSVHAWNTDVLFTTAAQAWQWSATLKPAAGTWDRCHNWLTNRRSLWWSIEEIETINYKDIYIYIDSILTTLFFTVMIFNGCPMQAQGVNLGFSKSVRVFETNDAGGWRLHVVACHAVAPGMSNVELQKGTTSTASGERGQSISTHRCDVFKPLKSSQGGTSTGINSPKRMWATELDLFETYKLWKAAQLTGIEKAKVTFVGSDCRSECRLRTPALNFRHRKAQQ